MNKLTKLNKEYNKVRDKELDCIILSIQMPTGEIENIVNPNVEEKINYINKTYNKDLVHNNCPDIFITEFIFVTKENKFDFSVALEILKDGGKVARKGWNGKGLYIELEQGGDYKFSELNPFFVIKNTLNSFNTWVPSVSDLLAEDWEEVK